MECTSDTVGKRLVDIIRENNTTQYNGSDIFNKFTESLRNRDETSACVYYTLFCLMSNQIVENKENYKRIKDACLEKIRDVFPTNYLII